MSINGNGIFKQFQTMRFIKPLEDSVIKEELKEGNKQEPEAKNNNGENNGSQNRAPAVQNGVIAWSDIDFKSIYVLNNINLNHQKDEPVIIGKTSDDDINTDPTIDLNVDDNNTNEKKIQYKFEDLTSEYNLTEEDIKVFFIQQDDKYVINKTAVKNCFNREDIDTVQQLLDAMLDDGFTIGYLRGAYNLTAEEVEKYFVKFETDISQEGDSTNFRTYYLFNATVIHSEFPDLRTPSVGQLKASILAKAASDTENANQPVELQEYLKEDLIDKYNFTERDLSVYFTAKDDKYVINRDFLENILSGKQITTAEELIESLLEAEYYEGLLFGLFGFKEDEVFDFFIKNEKGNYALNLDRLKKIFPDRDICALGQLKQAINETAYVSVISDDNKKQFLLELKSAFAGGDETWGFGNMRPNNEQIEKLYKQLLEDADIINFTGSVKDYKVFIIKKAAEYIKDIANDITIYTATELRENYDLSELQIKLFFSKNDDGTYKINLEYLKDFFDSNTTFTPEKIKSFSVGVPMNTKRIEMLSEFFTEALRNEDHDYGFNNLNPKLTEQEIQSFYWQIYNSCKKNKSFDVSAQSIMESLPKITNNIQLQKFENMINNGDFDKVVTGDEGKEYIDRYIELVKNALEYSGNYSKDYINEILAFSLQDLNIQPYVQPYSESEIEYIVNSYREYLKSKNEMKDEENKLSDEEIEQEVQLYSDKLKNIGKKSYNLEKILKQLDINFNNIKSVYFYEECNVSKKDSNGKYVSCIVNMWTDGVNAELFLHKMRNQYLDSDNIGQRFFAKIFNDATAGLDYYETITFVNLVFEALGEKQDEYGHIQFHQSGGGTYTDNIFDVVKRVRANIKHIEQSEVDNATSISDEYLYLIEDKDPEYIYDHLNEMLISDDPGIRKFAQMIKSCCLNYDTDAEGNVYSFDNCTKNQKLERIKWLIVLLNEQFDVPNPKGNPTLDNVSLSKELLNKLGDNIFDKIDEVKNSKKWENCYKADVNGIIESVFQNGGKNGTNDCWLLAGVIAINSTPEGKKMIADAIQWNEDYTAIIVTYPSRPNEPVTIPVELLLAVDADLQENAYISNTGDNDFLALAIAYEALYDDEVSVGGNGKSSFGTVCEVVGRLLSATMKYGDTFFEEFLPPAAEIHDEHDSALNIIGEAIGSLIGTGDDVIEMDYADVLNYLKQIAYAKQSGKNVAATFVIFATDTHKYSCGGWTKTMAMFTAHVMAITNINLVYHENGGIDLRNSTITFTDTDTNDGSTKEYTVCWHDFIKIGIAELSWAVW